MRVVLRKLEFLRSKKMERTYYLFDNEELQDMNLFINANRGRQVDIQFDMTPENETVTVVVLDD